MRHAAIKILIRHARLHIEQRALSARTRQRRLAPLADDVVVDHRDDFGPELRLGDVGVDVDQEVVFETFSLLGRMRENVPRVGLHRDFFKLTIGLCWHALEHGASP